MGPELVLSHRVRLNLRVMAMKGYYIFPRAPELEPHDQMHFSVIPRKPFLGEVLLLCKGYNQCILSTTDRVDTFYGWGVNKSDKQMFQDWTKFLFVVINNNLFCGSNPRYVVNDLQLALVVIVITSRSYTFDCTVILVFSQIVFAFLLKRLSFVMFFSFILSNSFFRCKTNPRNPRRRLNLHLSCLTAEVGITEKEYRDNRK